MVAAPFRHRKAFLAQRAVVRLIRRNGQVKQGLYVFLRHAEFGLAAAAVYEEADTNGNAAFALDDIEHFPDTAARRYNIFHHKDTGSRLMAKPRLKVILPLTRSVKKNLVPRFFATS